MARRALGGGDVVVKVAEKIFPFPGSPDGTTIGLTCGADRDTADEWPARFPGAAAAMAYIGRSGGMEHPDGR